MDGVCFQRDRDEIETCFDLELAGSFSEREYRALLSSYPASESFVAIHQISPSNESRIDVYRASAEGRPVGLRDISQLSGGRAPYLWRAAPIHTIRLGLKTYSSDQPTSSTVQNITVLTAERQLYQMTLSADLPHFHELKYAGSTVSAGLYAGLVDIFGDFLVREYRSGSLHREAFQTHSFNEVQEEPMSQGSGPQCVGREPLEEVLRGLSLPESASIPLMYDEEANRSLRSYAFYARSRDSELRLPFIGIGEDFLSHDADDQASILAHELGHHRYHREMDLSFAEYLSDSVYWRFQEEVSPGEALPPGVLLGLDRYLSLIGDHGALADSEIYADIVALEWIHRRDANLCRDDDLREDFVEHAQDHLLLIQERWPQAMAAVVLSELVYLFSSDPLLSPTTQEFACQLMRDTLSPNLRDAMVELYHLDEDPAAEIAAGVEPFDCWERLR